MRDRNLLFLGLVIGLAVAGRAEWKPAEGPLKTKWAAQVTPENAHREYPRPQMVRKEWQNLNGLWDLSIAARDSSAPAWFSRQILVPFPVESALSGVMTNVTEQHRLWYRRQFEVPNSWAGQRVLLHFGAVDFEVRVSVNGREVGQHRGGYDAFSFDITDVVKSSGANEIVVSVWDPTDASPYARGKQVRKPDQGIFYTATSGIWQTVWLEPVPKTYIQSLRLTPDVDRSLLRVTVQTSGDAVVELLARDGQREVARGQGKSGEEIQLAIAEPQLWSPEKPHLYDLAVELKTEGGTVDHVESYFGMRKVSLGKDGGVTRIFFNNKPYFMVGPLDQGFWPDGLYTAPSDEALRYDIEVTRKLGYNMARKHVKIEPARWYYWCDKLGLIVWQDMPSGDRFIGSNDPDITRTSESAQQFEKELKAMIDTHWNSPSIVMWVVFNEGWGQYDTARLAKWVKELDPSRLVNSASGWTDRGVGDVHDMHRYPGPGSPNPESNRAAVLGEFGGLGFKVDGHTWAGRTWGYRGMGSVEKLTRQYVKLLRGVDTLRKSPGLSAAVYTQTTDVEFEGNGLLTYDRAVIKMPVQVVANANEGIFGAEPELVVVIPTSETQAQTWRYTTEAPPVDWVQPGFDASAWKEGKGGFGTSGTPGAVVGTEWNTAEIWIRREINLPRNLQNPQLLIHHDEDAEVYINGALAARFNRWTTSYEEADLTTEGKAALRTGRNVVAIHCKQTGGGQYIDAGLAELVEKK